MSEPTAGPSQPQPTLRQTAISGARWTASARLIAEVAAFASVVFTARLLTPAQVGSAAVALLLVTVSAGLAQQGFGSPIVRKAQIGKTDASTAHVLSIAFGIVLGLLTFAMSPLLENSFPHDTVPLVQLAAVGFPISALGAIPMAMMQRALDFKRLAAIDAVASVAGGLGTLALAAVGLGAVSLVAGLLIGVGLTSFGCYLCSPKLGTGWSSSAAREIGRFGTPTAASNLLYILNKNVDYALLAARLPATDVGLYFRAFQLGSDYQGKISTVLLRLALPLFAKAQSTADLRAIRARMTRLHTVVLFPFLFALIGTAHTVIPFLFGEQWAPAASLTQVLAIAGMTAVVGTGTGPLLTAAGHPRALLIFTLLSLVAYAITVYLLIPYGLIAVCWGVVVNKVVSLYILQAWIVQPLVGIPAIDVLRHDILPAAAASTPVLILSWAITHFGAQIGLPSAAILAAAGAAGAAVYVTILRFAFRSAWRDVEALVKRRGSPVSA